MTKQEFESMTGKTVSTEEYQRINGVYMCLPDMSKQDFCRLYTDDPLELMSLLAGEAARSNKHALAVQQRAEKLAGDTVVWGPRVPYTLYAQASEFLGTAGVIRVKRKRGALLTEQERLYAQAYDI